MIEAARNILSSKNLGDRCLTVIFYLLSLLFAVSLFKNISYPLLWADESMTVMHGTRVLEYGYPKVHDGKNVVYDLRHPNLKLGIDEKTDAYIGGANWGMYYFAAVAVGLAQMSDDFFTKTAILRIPFALSGFIGLAILGLLGAEFFDRRSSRKAFWVLFAFFELISIPLVLHLREVRYYSLTVFLTALVIFAYTRFRILEKTKYSTYAVVLTVSLCLLFVTFSPGYFIFLMAISLHETIEFLKALASSVSKKGGPIPPGMPSLHPSLRHYLRNLLPIVLSLVAVSPLIYFFKTFYLAQEIAKYNILLFSISKVDMYLANLWVIWKYFRSFDLIYLAIFLKFCLLLSFIRVEAGEISSSDRCKLLFSNFMTILFVVYFFAIAQIPNFPFTRYFIPLQPVLAVVIIFDAGLVYHLISLRRSARHRYYQVVLLAGFIGLISIHVAKNIEYLEGHVYELFHQYRGPLDYLIPFIKETYGETDQLVIATNYEETSFMYYLKSKVIVGYVGNNLDEDKQAIPDVIVFRKGWGSRHRGIILDFFERRRYQRVSFPVFDYKVNNIPELNFPPQLFKHQFRTLMSGDERMKADIYLRR